MPGVPGSALALSREGSQLAYVAEGRSGGSGRGQQICVRRVDDLSVRPIPETEGAVSPFYSPDGAWLAFFTSGGLLKKVALAGGHPVVLVRDLPISVTTIGSWSDDGRIVFDTTSGGLKIVPAAGGAATALTTASHEWHLDPQVLPDSNVVLYFSQSINKLRVEAVSFDGKIRKTVLDDASHPRYLASGHLLFMRDGGLMLAPFDKDRLEITGPAVSVPLEVGVDHPNQSAPVPQLAVSLEGTLVYVPVPSASLRSSTLAWVDRRGTTEEVATVPFAALSLCLSPDGRQIGVTGREGGKARIDRYDLSRGTATRFIDLDVDWPTGPLFSRDGRRHVRRFPEGDARRASRPMADLDRNGPMTAASCVRPSWSWSRTGSKTSGA